MPLGYEADIKLTHAAKVNAKDSEGRTALHYAAIQGIRPDIAELLLAHGAKQPKDKGGKTPLDWAREKNAPNSLPYSNR